MVLNITTLRGCTLSLYLLVFVLLADLSFLPLFVEAKASIALLGIGQHGWDSLTARKADDHHETSFESRNSIILKKTSPPVVHGRTINQAQYQQQRGYPIGYRQHQHGLSNLGLVFSSDNKTAIVNGALRKALLSLQCPKLFGGDILLKTGGTRRNNRLIKYQRSALVSPISLWPGGVIFYEFDSSVAHLSELIWKVMQQFHDETCIRFIARKQNEPDYLRIESFKGCFSYIGRIGGEQTLSLGDGCEYRGTITHELLHAVGFYHHQNRSDRDDYLEIFWDNIAPGKENQFSKMAPQENILLNDFDYDSIMLYGPRTFGKTLDKVTMAPKREGVILLEVVEKQGLSRLDIDSVNKLYKCEPFESDNAAPSSEWCS